MLVSVCSGCFHSHRRRLGIETRLHVGKLKLCRECARSDLRSVDWYHGASRVLSVVSRSNIGGLNSYLYYFCGGSLL